MTNTEPLTAIRALLASLTARITPDNAMTEQAIMVRQANAELARHDAERACGHSVCSQHFIDTGSRACVALDHSEADAALDAALAELAAEVADAEPALTVLHVTIPAGRAGPRGMQAEGDVVAWFFDVDTEAEKARVQLQLRGWAFTESRVAFAPVDDYISDADELVRWMRGFRAAPTED